MKTKLLSLALLMPSMGYSSTLEDRVEELEFARDLNVVQWSGELNTRADSVTKETDGNKVNFNLYRMKFSLNIDANLSDRLAFHGRLTQSKVMNDVTGPGDELSALSNLHGYAGNELYVEKAYFDFKLTNNFILTLGRLPTAEGGPYHLTIGKPNRSSYPRLAYAYSLDGMALTDNLGGLSFKALYHPFPTSDRSDNFFKEKTLGTGQTSKTGDAHLWVGMVDYSLSNTFLAKKIDLNLHYVSAENLYIFSQTIPVDATTTVVSDLYLHTKRVSAYAELAGVMNTPLTVAVAHSAGSSRGFVSQNTTTVTDGAGTTVAVVVGEKSNPKPVYAAGTLLTLKYDLMISGKKHAVGAQYMSNNKFFSLTDLAGREPFNLWSVSGTAMHLFYNMPLENGLVWNTGYIEKNPKYSNGVDLEDAQITKSSSFYTEFILGF